MNFSELLQNSLDQLIIKRKNFFVVDTRRISLDRVKEEISLIDIPKLPKNCDDTVPILFDEASLNHLYDQLYPIIDLWPDVKKSSSMKRTLVIELIRNSEIEYREKLNCGRVEDSREENYSDYITECQIDLETFLTPPGKSKIDTDKARKTFFAPLIDTVRESLRSQARDDEKIWEFINACIIYEKLIEKGERLGLASEGLNKQLKDEVDQLRIREYDLNQIEGNIYTDENRRRARADQLKWNVEKTKLIIRQIEKFKEQLPFITFGE